MRIDRKTVIAAIAKRTISRRGAAERLNTNESTIRSAIARGELIEYPTACRYTRVLLVEEVDAWAAEERRPGRKAVAAKR